MLRFMSENNSVGTGIRSKCDLGMYQAGDSVILWYVNVCTSSSSDFCASNVQDFLSIPLVHVMLNDLLLQILLRTIASFPAFIPPTFGTSEFIACPFTQPLLLIVLLSLSADVQLNCIKNYSIGISLLSLSILLISISLFSSLNFLHISKFFIQFLLFSRILMYQMFNWSLVYELIYQMIETFFFSGILVSFECIAFLF